MKLKLKLEDLAVESFEVNGGGAELAIVQGYQGSWYPTDCHVEGCFNSGSCPHKDTCGETCASTCPASCNHTACVAAPGCGGTGGTGGGQLTIACYGDTADTCGFTDCEVNTAGTGNQVIG